MRFANCVSAMLMAFAGGVSAQTIPKSQLGVVSQLIADTRVEVTYRRPVARGRDLFGALVPWGRIWTPGADSAVRVTFSTPVEINGERLPAGAYSIWTLPDSLSWTVVFNRQAVAFHLRYPTGQDALRVQARPGRAEYVETLQWEFPMVDADSAVLQLHWGTVTVPLRLRVKP